MINIQKSIKGDKLNVYFTSCYSRLYHYSEDAITKLGKVLSDYKELDAIHKQGSVKTEKESIYERGIAAGIEEVVKELEKGGEVKADDVK